jgi:hypothetical protein
MAWARLDDNFYDHPKVAALLEEPDGWAALGFWTACLAWAHKHTRKPGKTPGFVPRATVTQMDRGLGTGFALLLVKAELWETAEGGWMVHDFDQYLPSAQLSSARAKAGSMGGRKSGQVRARRSNELRNEAPSLQNEASGEANTKQDTGTGTGSSKDLKVVDTHLVRAERADAERLCQQLADRIEANGSRRPAVTKAWRDAARRMIDLDGRTEDQVARAIDWCQNDEFWCSNILSMDKLRKQYDRLRLAAQRGSGGTKTATTDARVQDVLSMLDPGT